MKKVLVVAHFELHLASALNFLYENNFDALGALRDGEAEKFLMAFKPDVLIFLNHSDETKQNVLTKIVHDLGLSCAILQHKGGVNGLLETINAAFLSSWILT